MASVIQSGWLIFLLCAGVLLLLVGCATLNTRTSPQNMTAAPLVTLTVVPFQTGSTLLYSTPPAVQTELSLPPPEWRNTRTSSSGVGLNDPTCYNSPNQGMMCLGQISNHSENTLSNITIRVTLSDVDEQIVAEEIISIDQHYLPPQAAAPYRAQFINLNTRNLIGQATVENLASASQAQLPIRVTNERGRLVDSGRYVLTANLYNTSQKMADLVRLVVTVLNEDNHVVGYRVQSLERLASGASQQVRMEIIPQIVDSNLHHLLHVEAWSDD